MFKRLRVKAEPNQVTSEVPNLSISQLIGDASLPVTLRVVNSLPENPKLRLYRTLVPVQLLADFDINPRTWLNADKKPQVRLEAENGSNKVKISAWQGEDASETFFYLELADNAYNGIDLNFLIVSNPYADRFFTDIDQQGRATYFGTAHRNLAEEEKAMLAGLAPGQVRLGLRSSQIVFTHIEIFLIMLAQHAYFLEPLSYVSAWIFEKRGFAYIKGHQLMDSIHNEFQPGGELFRALDGSTPFRRPDAWMTVRGRAWAIHDGILEVIGKKWDGLRMIKQIGKHAGVNTFPGAEY
jgi:hypothetical protein